MPAPSFYAPLTTSIALTRGVGAPTFTRATAATVDNHEGRPSNVLAGEARFKGAMRVRNLIAASESIATWTLNAGGGTPAVRNSNTQFAVSGASSYIQTAIAGLNTKGVFVFSVDLSLASGTGNCDLRLVDGSDGSDSTTITVPLTTTVQRITVTGNMSASATFSGALGILIGNLASSGSLTININRMQPEDVTGQANQNPSPYVSVGVLAGPVYHGSGVDGVKCFDTTNGNTVAANVVTEAPGAAISSAALLGYLAEQASTNLCLQSSDIATTWTLAAATIGAAVAGPYGTTTAKKIQEDNTSARHTIVQSFTKAASALVYTLSIDCKQSERTWAALSIDDGTNNNGIVAWFNLATGATGSNGIGGIYTTPLGGVLLAIEAAANGFYRCKVTATSTAGAALRILCATAIGDGVSPVFLGTTNSGIYAENGQLEQNAFATSRIPTTTVAVTRNFDDLKYPTAGNALGTVGTAYAEITTGRTATSSGLPVFISTYTGTGGVMLDIADASRNVGIFDVATHRASSTALAAVPVTSPTKIATVWSAARTAGYVSGAGSAIAGFSGDLTLGANMGIGSHPATAGGEINGTIRNVKLWMVAPNDAFMRVQTT